MRRIIALVLLAGTLAVAGCMKPITGTTPPPVNKDWTISLSWQYDFTNYMVCSATVTTGCIKGFTAGYMNGTTLVPIGTINEPLPTCTGAAGSATAENCVVAGSSQPATINFQGNGQLPIGSIQFGVQANDISQAGAAQSSPVDSTTTATTVAAGSPTNITVTQAPF